MSTPRSIPVYQTDPDGYFLHEAVAYELFPPFPDPEGKISYGIGHLAVLVPPPKSIEGHRLRYLSDFGPYELGRRTHGEWIHEAPMPTEAPTEEVVN